MSVEFFDAIRPHFGGALLQSQVDTINAVFDAWRRAGDGDNRKLAYLLATAEHEPGKDMKPRHELGARSYFDKYDPGTKIGKALGNTDAGDGFRYRGRGLVQLTGRANYRRASRELNADLIGNPDLAINLDMAAMILVKGCMQGWFTGRKLPDYIGGDKCDYMNARRVVNGTDRAETIAYYAVAFEAALGATVPKNAVEPVRGGWLGAVVMLLMKLLALFAKNAKK